jgi:multidrug efflux pump subunit AcrA (membrane-fusion protein)
MEEDMGEERSRDSATPGINRRKFMRRAGATAAGVAVTAVGAEALLDSSEASGSEIPGEGRVPLSQVDPNELLEPGEIQGDTVAGVVITTGPQSLLVHPTEDVPVTVNVEPDAYLTIEGRVPFSAYEVGDEVVAVGERRGNTFTAKAITAVFRLKEVTIYSREGRTLQTSDGEILLRPWAVSRSGVWNGRRYLRVSPDALKPGDEILVEGTVNKRTGRMRAGFVVVPADGESLLGP